jgi:hypothetical protein
VCDNTVTCIECHDGYYRDEATKVCRNCAEECEICHGAGNEKCTVCSKNYAKWPDHTICAGFCPTGYTASEKVCVLDAQNICFTFSDKNFEALSVAGVSPTRKNSTRDPNPYSDRGLYFLPATYIDFPNLLLNT